MDVVQLLQHSPERIYEHTSVTVLLRNITLEILLKILTLEINNLHDIIGNTIKHPPTTNRQNESAILDLITFLHVAYTYKKYDPSICSNVTIN